MDRQRNRGTTGFWAAQASIIAVVLSLLTSALAQVAAENSVSDTTQKNLDFRSPSQTSNTKSLILKEWPVPATLLWKDAETTWPLGDTPRRIDAVPVLKEKGFDFPEGSNAFHITDLSKTPAGRLFVRNTQENLDRIDDIITGALLKAQRNVDEKAKRIIIPKLELREATLHDAIAFLAQTSRELDPEKQGVKITISPDLGNAKAAGMMVPNQARITVFSLKNIPLSEAMRYVTGLAGVTFAPTPEGYLVTALPDARFPQIKPEVLPNIGQAPVAGANSMLTKEWRVPAIAFREKIIPDPVGGKVSAREILSEEGVVFLPGSAAIWLPSSSKLIVRNTAENHDLVDQFVQRVAATIPAIEWAAAIATAKRNDPERKAFKNDSGIVIPSLEFRDVPLSEAVELLMAKALEADPKKKGVKITVGSDVEKNQGATPSDGASGVPTATISLRDIPFEEALVYVAGLFNRKVESAPDGFRLVSHSAKALSE